MPSAEAKEHLALYWTLLVHRLRYWIDCNATQYFGPLLASSETERQSLNSAVKQTPSKAPCILCPVSLTSALLCRVVPLPWVLGIVPPEVRFLSGETRYCSHGWRKYTQPVSEKPPFSALLPQTNKDTLASPSPPVTRRMQCPVYQPKASITN